MEFNIKFIIVRVNYFAKLYIITSTFNSSDINDLYNKMINGKIQYYFDNSINFLFRKHFNIRHYDLHIEQLKPFF